MAAARRRSPTASLLFLLCYSSVLLFFLRLSSSSSWSPSSRDDLSTCLAVYDEGGAPAVFESPKCPRWTLADESEGLGSSAVRRTPRCQPAVMQGRRRHLEDRAVCALDIRIPFPGVTGIEEVSCSIIAVFDGHNGAEASEMSSKLLVEYFLLHVYFLIDGIYSFPLKHELRRLLSAAGHTKVFRAFEPGGKDYNWKFERSNQLLTSIFERSFHMEILQESLLRTIRDIDIAFSKEAYTNGFNSGTTATVVLLVDGQILVTNVGDSKALICSEGSYLPSHAKGRLFNYNRWKRHKAAVTVSKRYSASDAIAFFYPKELTKDHHPDREDEKARVEAAGGYVFEWAGVARVNGELAISRAIGDVAYKSYGVTSVPEVTEWQPVSKNDSYLVVASDGIFEKMTVDDVCDLLWDAHKDMGFHPLANYIVNTAYEKGSMDNLAAVVFTLTNALERSKPRPCTEVASYKPQGLSLSKKPVDDVFGSNSSLISIDYFNRIAAKFKSLMVKGDNNGIGCFYLSENLKDSVDYVFKAQDCGINNEESLIIPWASSEIVGQCYHGGSILGSNEDNLCSLNSGKNFHNYKESEEFSMFTSLLNLLPLNDTSFNLNESAEHALTDFRYVLKKRYDRGAFGEVWLAVHWNCSSGDASTGSSEVGNVYLGGSYENCSSMDSSGGNLFILKRIMVEKGSTVYLSGLREKHFGEVFLNASISRSTKSYESACVFPHKSQMKGVHESTFKSCPYDAILSYEEGLKHIARYVESFESQSEEIWLVFHYEGMSLSKLIYTVEEPTSINGDEGDRKMINTPVLKPSLWWKWLKTSEAGKQEMRNIVWQLLMALKSCHDRNITHRDIKPENMIICFEDETGGCLRSFPSSDRLYTVNMRIIDFGSAIDGFTWKNLYGTHGPSSAEQTFEYAPPEALLNSSWFRGSTNSTLKYDMWSVGVVILELILGSPHVFDVGARVRTLLDQHLSGWSESMKDLAYRLKSLMEMCILDPGSSHARQHRPDRIKNDLNMWPASWKCSEEAFLHFVKSKDPLKLGFPNLNAMRLVRQLLRWNPDDRLSVDDALQHPYFSSP